jgi:threonine/homoserine/homoserine lactone efflux protein
VLRETNVALFVAAPLALIATPGPDMIYVVTRGVAQGRKSALVSACGVCSGLTVHTSFAAIGLSALLAQSAVAFSVVKYAGAAYLICLGIKTLSSKERFAISGETRQTRGLGSAFFQGVASNVLNPKVALFFLAFLPQFVSPDAASAVVQMHFLGAVFAMLGLLFLTLVAYFSGSLGERLGGSPRFASALRWLSGSILAGLGLRLALPERR